MVWDWLKGLFGGLGAIAPVAGPLFGAYLGQRGREQVAGGYQPGVTTTEPVPYGMYGPGTLGLMQEMLGGPAVGELPGLPEGYMPALSELLGEQMEAPGMSLEDYLNLIREEAYGPAMAGEATATMEDFIRGTRPELVGRHGQFLPAMGQEVAKSLGRQLAPGMAGAMTAAPGIISEMDQRRRAAILDTIKTGLATGMSQQDIALKVATLNQQAREALARQALESQRMGMAQRTAQVGATPAPPSPYEGYAALDWPALGKGIGGLSDYLRERV